MIQPWKTLSRKLLFKTNIFQAWQVNRETEDKKLQGEFYTLDTLDWVNIIAITQEENIVLINQFRHGTNEVSLEIPGGIVDEGESPDKTASRELLEETGYTGDKPILIGTMEPNPAIQTNLCYTYLIRNAKRNQHQDLEPLEEIEVQEKPLSQIPALLTGGAIKHALVVAAFKYLELWENG